MGSGNQWLGKVFVLLPALVSAWGAGVPRQWGSAWRPAAGVSSSDLWQNSARNSGTGRWSVVAQDGGTEREKKRGKKGERARWRWSWGGEEGRLGALFIGSVGFGGMRRAGS